MAYQARFMQRAIELAAQAKAKDGLEPFGAVIVVDGLIVGEGVNSSKVDFDPTAHGEIQAIRTASRKLKRLKLAGAELYSSCEPCPLCVAASTIACIERVYFAASIESAVAVLQQASGNKIHPIDVEKVRAFAGARVGAAGHPAEQHEEELGVNAIRMWVEPN